MSTLAALEINKVASSAKAVLDAVSAGLGAVPNLFCVAANSPAAFDALVGLDGALVKGHLRGTVRESIALDVARLNIVAGTEIDLSAVPASAQVAV